MRAGTLTSNVVILKAVIVKDEYGAEIKQYVEHITTRCNRRSKTGSRSIENYEMIHSDILELELRIYHKIDEEMRVSFNGKTYNIISIYSDSKKQIQTLTIERINE